jgi:hypothetical protein
VGPGLDLCSSAAAALGWWTKEAGDDIVARAWPLAQGEEALVDVATSVWASSPQRAAMAVDRLMALRLVSAAAIARWVRTSSQTNGSRFSASPVTTSNAGLMAADVACRWCLLAPWAVFVKAALCCCRALGLCAAPLQVFSSSGVAAPDDEAGGEVAWDILYAAVDKTAARTQVPAPSLIANRHRIKPQLSRQLFMDPAAH